jgi:cytochrome c551/c552
MGELLGIKEPHKEARCLACHAVDSGGDSGTREQVLAEGVGCSGCHGPAEKWVGVHYLPEWQAIPNEKKWKDYGFVPTKNLVARTLTCAKCHVGDDERDMNHDLIAAGHPRLAFEAAAYHYKPDYRKHWVERMPQPDFEVREWVVGQVVTLRAAAELLRARAEKAETGHAPWPEFSSYSCYACHQKVGEEALRGVAGTNPRPAGVPGWEVWSNAAVGIAAEYCGTAYPALSSSHLPNALKLGAVKRLRETTEAKRFPGARKVREEAAAAVAELDAWLVAMQRAQDRGLKPLPPGTAEKVAHALAANALANGPGGKPVLADHDWDALAANYLGCAAMFHARWAENPAGPEPGWGGKLWALRDELQFPAIAIKSGKAGERFNSPADLTQKKLFDLRDKFEALRGATAPRGGD